MLQLQGGEGRKGILEKIHIACVLWRRHGEVLVHEQSAHLLRC